jgi:putative transposase
METIHDYFGKKKKEAMNKYRSFVEELLGTEYDIPFSNTFGAAVLGTDEFREMVTSQHLAEKAVDRAIPGFRQFKQTRNRKRY